MTFRIIGKEHTRYSLILMKVDRITKKSIDDTITYFNSNSLEELQRVRYDLIVHHKFDENCLLDIAIYDYIEGHYCRGF